MINGILRYGMLGESVKEWQQILIKNGYDLSPNNDSGHFDSATHNATISWQKERKISADGIVGPETLNNIYKVSSKIVSLEDELKISFKQAKNFTNVKRTDIRWIVLHSMEAAEASTTAENVASWFASPGAPNASAHFCLDSDSIVQCVKVENIAWHAKGGNKYGIGLEHAGYARQTREQWLDPFSTSMLKLSAKLSAKLCKDWNIPVKFLDREALKCGEKGITTHNEITFAFKAGDHVDPGKGFPMDLYLTWINEYLI